MQNRGDTAMQTSVESTKTIAGAALIGLGILFCYDNLHQVATQLSHVFSFAARTVGTKTKTPLLRLESRDAR
jgi:hypothetical protein